MQLKLNLKSNWHSFLPVILVLLPATSFGGELFRDDFSGGLKPQWTVVDQGSLAVPSAWQVSGGVLRQTSTIGGTAQDALMQPGTYLLTGDATWTGYSLSTRFQKPRAGSIGLVFAYRGDGNYYRFSVSADAGSSSRAIRRLVKVVNGLVTVLSQDSATYEEGAWADLEVKFTTGTIEVKIDGKRVFQVSDVSHNAGRIGLYSWANAATAFDDVVVTTAPRTALLTLGQDKLLTDHFDAPLAAQWTQVGEVQGEVSQWQVAGGVLQQTSSIAGTYLLAGDLRWTTYIASVTMQSSTDGAIGLMFGYRDSGNFYRFSITRNGQQLSRDLVSLVAGVPTVLAHDDVADAQATSYAVEARFDGGNIEIWIDGQAVFQKADASFSSGKMALYSSANPGAQFDDVDVVGTMAPCQFSIAPSDATARAAGTTGTIAVTTTPGCQWTAVSNSSWISVTSGNAGSNGGTVGYSVQPSNVITTRQGTLTVAGQTFTVTQDAAACTYAISPTLRTMNPSATTGRVAVTTLAGCAWTAASNVPWMVITSAKTGQGSGVVNYTLKANSGSTQRQGTMTIADQTFTMTQSSLSACQFSVTPNIVSLNAFANSATVSITTTAGCSWTSFSNSSWITITAGKTGKANGKASFSVAANTAAESRTGSVVVAGVNVQVTQFASGVPNTHYVPSTGNLQLAIDQALPGDTITLQPGGVYRGTFYLRKKQGNEFITITSADPQSLPPPGTRVTPAYASALPKIVSPSNSPVLRSDDGASHYRLIGLEIQAPGWYSADLIRLGSNTATDSSLQASNFELDRLYIHGDPKLGAKRGIALNSASTVIRNCYISDIKGIGQETQAIGGWNGPGPYEITNNYLEAAGENIMFGGAVAATAGLIPSDITIQRNHFYKPLSWKKGEPSYAGKLWTVKNLLELKNARRVTVQGNVFENNWLQAQNGYAIVLTVRTLNVNPWAVVEDVTFTNNIIRHSGSGVNILGKDDNGGNLGIGHRLLIKNNVFEDIDYKRWGGDGRLIQVTHGAEDVTIDHNTVITNNAKIAVSLSGQPLVNFVFTNNILLRGISGVFGTGTVTANAALNRFAPGHVFANNALVGGGKPGNYPPSNFFPASFSAVGFTDAAGGDYHLSTTSPYLNADSNGGSLGADVDSITTATAGAVQP